MGSLTRLYMILSLLASFHLPHLTCRHVQETASSLSLPLYFSNRTFLTVNLVDISIYYIWFHSHSAQRQTVTAHQYNDTTKLRCQWLQLQLLKGMSVYTHRKIWRCFKFSLCCLLWSNSQLYLSGFKQLHYITQQQPSHCSTICIT